MTNETLLAPRKVKVGDRIRLCFDGDKEWPAAATGTAWCIVRRNKNGSFNFESEDGRSNLSNQVIRSCIIVTPPEK